jgi:citrate synthase
MSSNETAPAGIKPKKSVALSRVTAGNTALCTVGRSGNDLHYRGYDILDLADKCEFEEVAHLLVHSKLPNAAELRGYKAKLMRLHATGKRRSQLRGRARHRRPVARQPRIDALLLVPLQPLRPDHRGRIRR